MKWYEKQKKLFEQAKQEEMEREDTTEITVEELPLKEDMEDTEASFLPVENMVYDTDIAQTEAYETMVMDSQAVQEPQAKLPPVKETTVIQQSTSFSGAIDTDDNVTIHGQLIGDIHCGGDLLVTGSIKGNISCRSAVFTHANVEGDIQCVLDATISQESTICGDITSKTLCCSGRIKGNLNVEESMSITASAILLGDVVSRELDIERGAILRGMMQIAQDRMD